MTSRPADERVLAASIADGAEVVVTENEFDFPVARLPVRAQSAVVVIAARSSGTPIEDVLAGVESRYAMGEACALMREVI